MDEMEKTNELIERLNELERRKNPPSESMLKYFAYAHLHPPMQDISHVFHSLAQWLVECEWVIDDRERQVALRKLLEAKDAAVRSAIMRD